MSSPDASSTDAELIAPFVAWMATQDLGESTRRAYREAVSRTLPIDHHQSPAPARHEPPGAG